MAEYSDALDHFLASAAPTSTPGSARPCAEVGLPVDRLDVEMGALSGGQFARAALAAILLSRFDVLLLDEPTNNLDFVGLERLERFVQSTPERGGDGLARPRVPRRAVDRILEIEEATAPRRGVRRRVVRLRRGARIWPAARATTSTRSTSRSATRCTARAQTQRAWSEQGKAQGEEAAARPTSTSATSRRPAARSRRRRRRSPSGRSSGSSRSRSRGRAGSCGSSSRRPTRSGDVVARLEGAVDRSGARSRSGRSTSRSGGRSGSRSSGRTAPARPRCSACCSASCRSPPAGAGSGPGVTIGAMDQARDAFLDRGVAARRVRGARPAFDLDRGPLAAREVRSRRGRRRAPGRDAVAGGAEPGEARRADGARA